MSPQVSSRAVCPCATLKHTLVALDLRGRKGVGNQQLNMQRGMIPLNINENVFTLYSIPTVRQYFIRLPQYKPA